MLTINMDDAKVISDSVKDKEIIAEAKALIQHKNGRIDAYNSACRSLYTCPSCETVHNRFYFRLLHDDGVFEPTYPCPHCKGRLTNLGYGMTKPLENIRCSSCHQKGTLIEVGAISWD